MSKLVQARVKRKLYRKFQWFDVGDTVELTKPEFDSYRVSGQVEPLEQEETAGTAANQKSKGTKK